VLWQSLQPALFGGAADVGFVGIGTIAGMPCDGFRQLHVFSSGTGNHRASNWGDIEVRYWCVRGPVTARTFGLDPGLVLTDGAILSPLSPALPKLSTAGAGVAVVPHFETLDFPGWDETSRLTGFQIVDPRDTPFNVIDKISKARLVLTESLHGAILADTYGIPWIAFATSSNFGATKWLDWTASLDLPFDLSIVPPPDAGPLLAFGRRSEPFGSTVRLDVEQAHSEFETRLAPPRRRVLRDAAKGLMKRSRLLRRVLPFNPSRTAEALQDLARRKPSLSPHGRRVELQERMMQRLAELARSAG